MNYNIPFYPCNHCRTNQVPYPCNILKEALALVKGAVQQEEQEKPFYDYLISGASTSEEKNIIASIRNDERKHYRLLKELYYFYTKENIASLKNVDFERPESYTEGIIKAKIGELSAIKGYTEIVAGIPERYYKAVVFEIMMDKFKHAGQYDYILYLGSKKYNARSNKLKDKEKNYCQMQDSFRETRKFTLEELSQYDGSSGRPAYAAVNGIVYDLSNEATWGGATHFGLTAGKDLTQQFQGCHGMEEILARLPKVGIL